MDIPITGNPQKHPLGQEIPMTRISSLETPSHNGHSSGQSTVAAESSQGTLEDKKSIEKDTVLPTTGAANDNQTGIELPDAATLTDRAHVAFREQFGDVDPRAVLRTLEGLKVSNEKELFTCLCLTYPSLAEQMQYLYDHLNALGNLINKNAYSYSTDYELQVLSKPWKIYWQYGMNRLRNVKPSNYLEWSDKLSDICTTVDVIDRGWDDLRLNISQIIEIPSRIQKVKSQMDSTMEFLRHEISTLKEIDDIARKAYQGRSHHLA
jgi:hypothetical protein